MNKINKEKIINEFIYTYLDNPPYNTKKTYKCLIKDFLDFISPGDYVSVRNINKTPVIRYLNSKTRKWSQNTRRTKTILIKNFLKFLYKKKFLKEQIYEEIKLLPKVNIERYFPSDEDIKKFFKAIDFIYKNEADKIRFRTIFEVYPKLGLRFTELINLDYEDIDFERKKIILKNTKNKEQPHLAMDPELEKILKDYIEYFNIKSGPLFKGKLGRRIERHVIDNNFNKIKKAAGLPKEFTIHCFRRYFITTLNRKGVDPFLISKLARHKDIQTTLSYIGHTEEEKRKAMAFINLGSL